MRYAKRAKTGAKTSTKPAEDIRLRRRQSLGRETVQRPETSAVEPSAQPSAESSAEPITVDPRPNTDRLERKFDIWWKWW